MELADLIRRLHEFRAEVTQTLVVPRECLALDEVELDSERCLQMLTDRLFLLKNGLLLLKSRPVLPKSRPLPLQNCLLALKRRVLLLENRVLLAKNRLLSQQRLSKFGEFGRHGRVVGDLVPEQSPGDSCDDSFDEAKP